MEYLPLLQPSLSFSPSLFCSSARRDAGYYNGTCTKSAGSSFALPEDFKPMENEQQEKADTPKKMVVVQAEDTPKVLKPSRQGTAAHDQT